MNSIQDCYTLNNGMKLPCVGFGTYQTINGDGKAVILDAIRAGYRFFDAASLYETERALGAAIKESGLPREDFIIETKLWIDEMGYENAKKALAASLERLQMDYVALYMIHWPRQTGADDENWKALDLETWRAMEEMVDEGKVRALGCSNFLPHHLQNLLDHCSPVTRFLIGLPKNMTARSHRSACVFSYKRGFSRSRRHLLMNT